MQSPSGLRSSAARAIGLGALSLLWPACGGEDISAPTTGEIAVSISTTGSPDPGSFTIRLDGQPSTAVSSNATLSLTVEEGDHALELGGLVPGCAVDGGVRREVQVKAGDTTAVSFSVACGPTTGGVRVVTTTSGALLDPDGYLLTVDQAAPQPIGINAALDLTALAEGDHTLQLSGVADNCGVTTENPKVVAVGAGEVAEAAFDIVCVGSVQRWTPVESGTIADLVDAWGSSATDVFVVGEIENEEQFEVASVIRHYDGTGWVQQHRETDLVLSGVWGSSPTDVYAVGLDFSAPVARMLHFDGTQWSEVPRFRPNLFELSITFKSVWGSSASDVFAVGATFDAEFERSLVFHYDGSGWRRLLVTGDVRPALEDVWGSSATDVYAVGRNDVAEPATGVILHYNGVAWAPVLEEEGLALNALWGSSATDVFVVGFRVEETDESSQSFGAILHFDGSNWTHMPLPTVGVLNEVWGSSATDVFAVGDGGVVLHYDGAAWTATNPTTATLLGIWGSSPGDVYAVGGQGTILHGTP